MTTPSPPPEVHVRLVCAETSVFAQDNSPCYVCGRRLVATPQPSADMVPSGWFAGTEDADGNALVTVRADMLTALGECAMTPALVSIRIGDERLTRGELTARLMDAVKLATTAQPAAPTETVLDALRELLWCARSQIPAAVLGSDAQNAWSDRCAAARNKAEALLEGIQPTEHPDTKRLDWLENAVCEQLSVRLCFAVDLFGEDDDPDVGDSLRAAIDKASLAQPSQPAETGERKPEGGRE